MRRLLASMIGAASVAAGLVLSLFDAGSIAVAVDSSAIDPVGIVRGAQLAAVGNCGSCHTRDAGQPYAGGRAVETPFGTIFSTNITPDPVTGIGNWTQTDFLRAMHEGVGIGGRQLYPAYPYDHFTKVTDDDVGAIYAFVMTRDPVVAETPRNELHFPFNMRPLLAVWRALFFKPGVYQPDPSRSEEWNRGAYLVTGLGHCGACHTQHDGFGVEDRQRPLGGGAAESWHAPALNAASIAPMPWTAEQLVNYLRHGDDDAHGIAAGPMEPVTHNLSQIPERDVRAIAYYLASTMAPADGLRRIAPEGAATADRERLARVAEPPGIVARRGEAPAALGAMIYADACATCHDASAAPSAKTVPLAQTTSVNAPDPRNVIHIVLDGIWPPVGEAGALMPGFAGELTLQQTAALVEYLRSQFSEQPAWNDVPETLRAIAGHRDRP